MRKWLRKSRNDKKIKQIEIANELGMTIQSYQRIEYGLNGTTEKNWLKLFEMFEGKVPLNKLMENSNEKIEKKPVGKQA